MTDVTQEATPPAGARTVGVVMPMYNSAATIGDTLASIAAQTHTDLDIVVVDDGSTDESAAKVRDWCARDGRIRLISQPNAGVAAARNTGAGSTTAPYLAFLDADDLWAPDKVRAQMERLDEEGEPALVWCWYVQIDEQDIPEVPGLMHYAGKGDCLRALARANEVGNGSSMLMPRNIFETVGGFDSSLRENGAQGCEDYEFPLKVAERFPLKVVKRHLVGYRLTHNNSRAALLGCGTRGRS